VVDRRKSVGAATNPYYLQQTALHYLQQRGLSLLARNYRCKLGELDLVMRDRTMVVFVEVRFRARLQHGSPQETVNAAKQMRLRRAAQHFLQWHPPQRDAPCRFDVLALWPDIAGNLECLWIQAAFY
jgi:putative endonuclease